MPCYLHVSLNEGSRAVADQLALEPYSVRERGEAVPARPSHSYERAGLSFEVSEADFDQLAQQFDDASSFLARHEADVALLVSAGEAVLDFGYQARNVALQVDRVPIHLIRRAADLGVEIELSLYQF